MSPQQVIDIIEDAFKDTTLDGGRGLWLAQFSDKCFFYGLDEKDKAEAIEKDEKLDWHNLDSNDLKNCESSLSHFDEKGMRFHLPAFIIAEIKDELECGVIFNLTHLSEHSRKQFSLLNSKQKKAITSFLEWCLKSENYEYDWTKIKNAIEKYWKL